MAIAFDKSGVAQAVNSTTATVSLAAASSNSFAIIATENGGGADGTVDDFVSCKVGGVSATEISTVRTNATTRYFRAFYFLNPPTTSTAYTITGSTATSQQENAIIVAIYSGAAQTGQPDSSNQGNATGNLTISTTVVAANCWLAAVALGGGNTLTAGAGTTLRNSTGAAGMAVGDSNGTVGTGSQSLIFNNSNGSLRTDAFIVSIAPSAATAPPFKSLLGVGI